MTISKHGEWPGVVAFANDAHMMCVECASQVYTRKAVMDVIYGRPGYEEYTDYEGNPLNPILCGSGDLHTEHCMGACYTRFIEGKFTEEDIRLCDDDCECYEKDTEDTEVDES